MRPASRSRTIMWLHNSLLAGAVLTAPVLALAQETAAPPAGAPAQTAPPAQLQPVPTTPAAPQAPAAGTVLPPGTALPPGAIVSGPAIDSGCEYWIVSSRNCKEKQAGCDTCCLQYFHRTSERTLQDAGRTTFFASIRPDVPVCFVVHGSYNWWKDVVNESRRINQWIRSPNPGAPLQVVFFTWPSDGNMPYAFPVDIALLGRKSSSHAYYLASLISQLPPEQPVSVVGHSHGARSVVAALHLLGGGAVEDKQALPPGTAYPHRLRAVLIAAAIDQTWMNPGQRYGQALFPPERILLMRNSRDATLAVYPLRKFGGERALGKDGLRLNERLAMNGLGAKIVDLDAAQFAGANHAFADYHEHAELAAAAAPYVFFENDGSGAPSLPTISTTTPTTGTPAAPTQPQPNVPATVGKKLQPVPNGTSPPPPVSQPQISPAGGPQLPPATGPDLTPPGSRVQPASDEAQGGTARVIKIAPRSRKASQSKLREKAAETQEKLDSKSRELKKTFDLWLED